MRISQFVGEARRGFWHLRQGGPAQLRSWWRRRRFREDSTATLSTRDSWNPLGVDEYTPLPLAKSFGSIRAAVILDDFSLLAWGCEFDTVAVTPESWRETVDSGIDLLLVESAWNANGGAWQYQLTGPSAPSAALQELTAYCRERQIPTIFWNKEDPPHFEDFLETAQLFDVVFTTDANKVPDYQEALGHSNIHVMSFAAQPAVHNPVRIPGLHQRGDIAFAGMYFAHKFPERREQLQLLLSAAVDVSPRMEHGLTIYARFAELDEKYRFPEPFDDHVVGSLPYLKMLTAYRAFKVFLNVNSVTDSPSMCARRIFEITASGTPVVSTPSAAIRNYFPADEIPTVDDEQETGFLLRGLVNSAHFRDRMVHKAQRRIWGAHTYAHRAEQVLSAAGIEHNPVERPSVSVVVSTNRPEQFEHILRQVARQKDVDLEFLLLTHGFSIDQAEFDHRCSDHGLTNARLLSAPSDWSLGSCLNALIAEASGDVVAKFDDDDHYGDHYLVDQLNALRYSGADVVGKEAGYAYLSAFNALVLRRPTREHRWTTFVSGPTLVAYRRVFTAVPFSDVTRGEDSAFLRDALDAGMKIYAADRFNFIQMRGHGSHTWSADDAEFLANGVVESFGLNTEHVDV